MQSEIHSDIDLYDSDRAALQQVVAILNGNIGKRRDVDAFAREATERIAEAGFVAQVVVKEDPAEDHLPRHERTYYPQVSLIGRIEPESEFDHDKMGHEVRSDLLGLRGGDNRQRTQVGQPGFESRSSGLVVPRE